MPLMVNINVNSLNQLEKKIHNTILKTSSSRSNISINDSAELCGCSISKISKFVKKLGFANYKQYIQFVYGTTPDKNNTNSEFDRIRFFMDHFDSSIVEYISELIENFDRIILLGYGPTFYVLSYFEFKLRIIANKNVFAVQEEQIAINMLEENKANNDTLLLCFSVSGNFRSFARVYDAAQKTQVDSVIILEEYNPKAVHQFENAILLTEDVQPNPWRVYEKTRVLFFILIEEIMSVIVKRLYERKALESEKINDVDTKA